MWYVFSVYDKKACEYGNLYLARKHEVAARMFADAVTPESTLGKYPADFCLFCLGQFDEASGAYHEGREHVPVIEAAAVVALRGGNGAG